jgi:hypothetical protein
MGRILPCLFLCLAITVGFASARTWIIEPDGTGDAPTIKAGMDSASYGDTVLVGCGTYYEHNIQMKSGVCLSSVTGTFDCAKINGLNEGRIFHAECDSSASIIGFTAVQGLVYESFGGGIYEFDSALNVSNCKFRHCGSYYTGGAAFLSQSASVYTDCVFQDSWSVGMHFAARHGGGVCAGYGGSPTFINCAFLDNTADYGFGGGAAAWLHVDATFRGCLFAGNEALYPFGGGGLAVLANSSAEVSDCTFYGNFSANAYFAGGVICGDTSFVSLENCIIASSRRGTAFYWDGIGTEAVITCCDFYGNPDGDWVGPIADQYGINGNISEDPLFCDFLAYDFHLCSISPCLEADTCGTLGAYGLGCVHDSTDVLWTDVTTDILGEDGAGSGLAWVDYDTDGDLDLYFTNRVTDENALLRNHDRTAEGFIYAQPPTLSDPANSRGCPWGDYDGDGDPDLYVSVKGANKLIRNDDDAGFVDVTTPPLNDGGTGQAAAWFDYDNDGDLDIYLVNNGANKLFRNDSAGVFTDVTSGPLGDASWGMGLGLADYDNDGDMDVYVANYDNTANVLMQNQGGGVFVDVTTPVLECALSSYGAAWGDYDNDGDLDLYVTNEGPNNLLRNDAGSFTDVTVSPLGDAGYGRSAAWGDYDNDGDLDLYLVNWDGANRIFRNDGDEFTVGPGCACPVTSDVREGFSTAWADYDKDGDLDLYLVNDGANRLYRNELEPGYHWLEVDPVGMISNPDGVGARVRVVAGGMAQMREIAGASGFASQGPLTAWFGLGSETMVDTLQVIWPRGGTVRTMTDVAADQTLEVVESDVSGIVDRARPTAFRLYPSSPNPFSTATAIRYDLPEVARVRLAVYDVSGRLVCTILDNDRKGPGRHTAYWGGCNAEGHPVAPGIYFCELRTGTYSGIERMVLLK